MFFKGKALQNDEKLYGCYYTPDQIANFLVKWAIRSVDENVLEPSCGDGQFFKAMDSQLQPSVANEITVTGVEINPIEAKKTTAFLEQSSIKNYHIEVLDFFECYKIFPHQKFSVVVGNPPFIRFQNMTEQNRNAIFELIRDIGYKPSKLSNAWCAFLQLSIEIIRKNGRLAMVIPAELLQVSYAKELRHRLTRSFQKITLIHFKRNAFPGILQEVVLLLADNKCQYKEKQSCGIQTIELENVSELESLTFDDKFSFDQPVRSETPGLKWTSLFIDNNLFELACNINDTFKFKKLNYFASVDVGIVTGRNSFFIIDDRFKHHFENTTENFFIKIIGKTSALKSINFCLRDFKEYCKSFPCYLLNTNSKDKSEFSKQLLKYIHSGESAGVHTGYKCRIRKRWYDVPSISIPDAFIFRQIHQYPLIVTNVAKVATTDTIHRVSYIKKVSSKKFSALFFNSFTLLWCEIIGRSYGGGLLELQPSEAEDLPIIYDEKIQIDSTKVDTLLRSGNWEAALDYVDNCSLIMYYGIPESQVKAIRSAWTQLQQRRLMRNTLK